MKVTTLRNNIPETTNIGAYTSTLAVATGAGESLASTSTPVFAFNVARNTDVRTEITRLEDQGFGQLPVCMAKTPASLSTDPKLKGRPTGFDVPIREVRLSSGAGFIVALTGDVITMPGLPKTPAAENIDVDDEGLIQGLF